MSRQLCAAQSQQLEQLQAQLRQLQGAQQQAAAAGGRGRAVPQEGGDPAKAQHSTKAAEQVGLGGRWGCGGPQLGVRSLGWEEVGGMEQ